MSDVPALQVDDVRRSFGEVAVLKGVSLTVEADELVALVGENGAGKTTLVRCVAGMLEPDAGAITIGAQQLIGGRPARAADVDVVWQDLALCENLDVVDNLFLGREHAWVLEGQPDRQVRARDLLEQLDIRITDLGQPISRLSGGQRQAVALARTLITTARLLVLDEPTTALDRAGMKAVETLIGSMRSRGTAILLVSHNLELVCEVADRALVLRDGRITADVRRPHLTVDELRARMSGLESDAMARQQLHQLRSLVQQLADVKPSAVLPLILSAVSVALEQDRVALHLVQREGDPSGGLRLAAGLGLGTGLRAALSTITPSTHPLAEAVRTRAAVVSPAVSRHADPSTAELVTHGVRSLWTVPLIGGNDVLGTLSGYGRAVGEVSADTLELASLYASHAAAALDRERLLGDLTRRNQTLETVRQMLETLAGPADDDAGLRIALDALRAGLHADDVALVLRDDALVPAGDATGTITTGSGSGSWARQLVVEGGTWPLVTTDQDDRPVLGAQLPPPDAMAASPGALLARWPAGARPSERAEGLLTDGARSVHLALERRMHEQARHEATTLRRSNQLQRQFLARLSHELRTPLTAIHGYADTLRQPDVDWDHSSAKRFLDTIVRESGRLGSLVTDLLDASAIEADVLRLQLDWCDVLLVVDAALAVIPDEPHTIRVDVSQPVPPVRADHQRLQQVLVNLLSNAVAHTPGDTHVDVGVAADGPDHLCITVADDGPGIPERLVDSIWRAGVRGEDSHDGAGLGLAIVKGIVDAHGGSLAIERGTPGTTFVVRLPVGGPPAAEDQGAERTSTRSTGTTSTTAQEVGT